MIAIDLYFISTGIDSTKPSNIQYLDSRNETEFILNFAISLRSCEVGEAFLQTGECKTCSSGTEYSLVSFNEESDCKECPTDKAICNGGSDIGPKAGYWRSSNTSDNFIE